MQPLGYYADTTIKVVGDIEREYGSQLEQMSEVQKYFLLFDIADNLNNLNDDDFPPETFALANHIRNEITSEADLVTLVKAIAQSL